MKKINQNNNLQKIIPILTDNNYSELKLRMIICLKLQRLYQYFIKQCVPGDEETRTLAVDANVEACGIITNFMDSRTFAALVTSEDITQNHYLLWNKVNDQFAYFSFNSKTRVWSNDIASVGIAVEDEILAFSILTKLPDEFHSLLEKVILNAETQGNPDAILNVLHEAALKEEALSNDSTKALALNKINFPSKIVHYCSNGRHNPLVTTHGPEKFWQLHPELEPEKKKQDKEQKTNFTISQDSKSSNTTLSLVVDTGASNHMFNNKHFFENLNQDFQTSIATGCDKSMLISKGQGSAKNFDPLDNNTYPSFICPISSGLLETQINSTTSHCLNTQVKENGDLWHKQLGHMNKFDMRKLVNTTDVINICNGCIKGEISQLPFKHSFKKANHVLENGHLDLCGPFQTPSLAGAKYFLIIVDQLSGFITTKLLKNKKNCFNHFRNFKLSAENLQLTKINKITTDGGGEFVNKSFKNHCLKSGIEHITSPPYTPQHNPFSEKEAVSTPTFLCNLIPKHKDHIAPHEIWHKSKPPLNKLKPFGCQAWLKIPKYFLENKCSSRAWDGILLGYENEESSYQILRIQDQKVVIRLIQNLEKSLNHPPEDNPQSTESILSDGKDEYSFVDVPEQQPPKIKVIGPRHPTLISIDINSNNILPFHRRKPRINLIKQTCSIPNSFEEAMNSPNKEKWYLVIQKELLNINKINVWTLRNKTINDHPITSMWVFKENQDNNGKIIEYKSQLCAHGFHQIAGLDYQSTYAPTGRLSSLQVLISFAGINKYKFHQMDVRSAFLNAPLEENICLEIPQCVEGNKKTKVLHLNKALYGLKQASLAWFKHLMWISMFPCQSLRFLEKR
ncbi:hypothetical protein O181_065973 [Austropuccinia psidii MF-1]|uniref:Integrase catalytic domain-containing protein n=1 Tax=Austropuccinia psidii MF-1 TaxID=1389203 RepID=A0A9Q3EWA0_9BASI|nr:hypothetical protein [Austropuccinia psidii MF-1]